VEEIASSVTAPGDLMIARCVGETGALFSNTGKRRSIENIGNQFDASVGALEDWR
jgi:hypothetical protein